MSIVTKSGTNELKGSVYELTRNDRFDSTPIIDPMTGKQFPGNLAIGRDLGDLA